jgi:polysaccharide biosynthesis transport protein
MELREFFAPLMRWWWLLLAAAGVAAIFSLIVGLQQPPVYQTSTTLMIGRAMDDPNPSDMQLYTSQQLATTYADIVARRPVREATMAALGLDWLPKYVARPVTNTQLMEIVVDDTDPARAQAVATELANQLILQSPTSRQEDQARQGFINQQLDDLEQKIGETQVEIDARQSELSNLTSARQIADTQNQIYALQTKLDTLRSNYTELLANTQRGALNTLTIIEPAVLPEEPVGPNVPLLVIIAASFALAVAIGATYLLDYLDNTIKSPEEIKRLTGLPMLVGIPTITGEAYPEKLITITHPRSPISEAYRSLRTGVQFSTIDRPENNAVLVTSASPSEGKSITAANLATVIAQAGLRVLLIDSDLRRPVMHKIFELENHTGLTDLLRNVKLNDLEESVNAWLDKVAQPTKTEGLWVLTSGPIPPNPSEILGSKTNQMLLDSLKHHFDYVVLDSPPVLLVTDAVVLSTQVDGTVLVVDADQTQKNQLRQSVERMREVNANLLGIVVNRLSPKMDGYSGYYHYYYYRKTGNGGYGYQAGQHSSNGKGVTAEVKKILRGLTGNKDKPKKQDTTST